MIVNENWACLSGQHQRAAAPARAREIVRSDFQSDANGDSVAGSPAVDGDPQERRIAELRRRVQSGTYEVNAEAVSARIIDEHVEG